MQTNVSASCCHSTPLVNTLSSKATSTVWPLPESVRRIGLFTPVIRRMESAEPSLRVKGMVSGAAGCSPLAFSEQVAALMSKWTFSSLEAAKYGWKPMLNGRALSLVLCTVSSNPALAPDRV